MPWRSEGVKALCVRMVFAFLKSMRNESTSTTLGFDQFVPVCNENN